jgi:hypothetical protein
MHSRKIAAIIADRLLYWFIVVRIKSVTIRFMEKLLLR